MFSFSESVVDAFKSVGLTVITDHTVFHPHITIARCNRDKELAKALIAQKNPDFELGNENVKEIVLCRMSMDKNRDEFYRILHSESLFLKKQLPEFEIK